MALTRPRYSQIPDTDWKQSVRVATTEDVGNVMLAAMPSTVDGVTLNFYDRVLLRSQANAAQNGIYYVKAVGTGSNGIWERTKDAGSGGALGAVTPSIVTQVEEGDVNKNRTFKLTTTGNIDLGTTDLSFGVQAAEPAGLAGQLQFANVNNVIGGAQTTSYDYTTGNLTLTGNVNTTLLYQNGKRVPQVFTSETPPSTPAVGDQWYQVGTDILYEWLQDGSTAYWIDVSGATIANVNPITGQTVGTLVVNGGNDSTSTTTGALQVIGGVGITGNLNVGGSVSFGGGQLGSDLVISSNTTSISETTGAIRIASPGGLGVGGNIWAGGAIVANSRIPSTSITTGAFVVPGTGGVGIGGNLNVGGTITGGGVRQSISSSAPSNPTIGDQWYQLGTDVLYQYVSDGTGSYWVDVAGATVANISQQTNTVNDIHLVSGTPSTDPSTGALIVSGGVGITGNLNLAGGFNITGGNIVANQNVTSIDTTTGSMVVSGQGGLGVGGNINVGGNLNVAQTASFLQNVIISANLVAGGTYFAAGGLSVTNGNVVASGTNAQIGGLTITAGAISGIASLSTTGNLDVGASATIGGDLAVTGNITGGGLRKYAQVSKPTNPVVGDVWYKTDTDVYYTYVNDGTNTYWIDYAGATVANITPQTNQTLSDIVIVSGTPSTNTTSGALQVQGGAGITGNVFTGNLSTATVSATNFTYANGVSILEGNQGTYSNANVVAHLAASDVSVGGNISASGNLTASGSYFSAGGLSVSAGNILATGARAVIGGLTIENGGISSLASLNVIGSGTLGGDFAITGNITAGGLRKYAQVGAPANPVVGDVWYKTDTDVFYQYVNDGTSKYWIDYTSATVSNASPTSPQSLQDLQIVSGTPSTGSGTGALQVTGGAAVTGNVFAGNLSTTTVAADQFTFANGVSLLNGYYQGTYSNANVTAYLTARTTTISDGFLSTAGMTVTAGNLKTTSANIGGVVIENGGVSQLASLGVIGAATIGSDLAVTGNITGGGLRKYAQVNAPANPVVGDVWYKTDTDVYYQYITDGTKNIWVDYSSATVSNASPTTSQSLQDLQIVSGTESTSTSTGALVVQGGIGASGNVFAGNVTTGTLTATTVNSSGVVVGSDFTYANGVSILVGNEGTYSNSNVTAYLTARTTTISDGFLSTAGMTVTAGNLKTTSANIGGLIIENGGFGSLASLGVVGSATIGGDLAVTGNITGGGLRKYAQVNAPANPVVGDVWYKTDTDVYYTYINDGTNKYWVDYIGATVSNASITSEQIAYDIVITTDTQSTSTTTGAVRVQGGIGLIGNIYTTGIADFGGNLTAGNILSNNNLQTTTLQVVGDTNVNKLTATGNITSAGTYFSAGGISVTNGNVVATGTTATIGGLVINNGGLPSLPSIGVIGAATFGANVDITGNVNVTRDIIASGNIVAGGVRKYAQISKPANAVPGDVWYKTDTDVYYTYINDGTNSYWVDYVGATVSNAAVDNSTNNDFAIASGTASTDYNTGALTVVGGVGVDGDLNISGDLGIAGTFTADAGATVGYLNVTDGIDSYGNVIIHGPGTENYTVQVRSSDAADNVLGIKTSVAGGGFAIDSMDSELTGATPLGINANTFSIGIKNAIGATVQADAFKLDTAGNASVAKTLSVGQHVSVTGNVSASNANFTKVIATTANFTTLNLSGTLTVSALNVTTSIDAPGIRKYAQTSAPASPAAGDVWYKTDTDVYYTYVNDGTNSYWIDYVGATVSNAAVDNSTNNDFRIASGTESVDTDTGALTVVGGVGVVGNIFAGGIVSAQGQLRAISGAQSDSTTTGALVVTGGLGVSANTHIGGALAADSLEIAGPTNLYGNLYGTNMTLSGRADIAGAVAVTGNVDISGRVTGGGIRKTTSISAPVNPTVGDVWYKSDTDVLYQYINDGTTNYWVDYVGPTVSNASPSTGLLSDLEIVTGTPSTSTITGAARITGGVGITENLYVGQLATIGANLLANNITANINLQSATAAIIGNLTAGNLATGIATIARADIAGALAVGGDVTVTGNIVAGGVRKTQSTTPPANPTVGDLWYKTDTDVYYQYTSDGTNKYWIDYVGATVSNAAVSASTNNDYRIASGTASTNTDTGALTVVGGVGITGNVNIGGSVIATGFYSDNFSFANGTTLADRITGTFSNTNVAAYLTGAITTGNITAGNITAGNIAVLDITARNVTLSGNITGGGLRKYAQVGAPTTPIVGDVWYKTDTDVYYQYINDGTNTFWVDYVGPTISNATIDNSTNIDFTIASGTESTSYSTGALRVVGGVGVVGNIYASNNIVIGDNLTVNGTTALQGATATTLDVSGAATVGTTLAVTGNITAGSARLAGGGLVAEYGNLTASGAYLSAGGISATSGILSVGNIISSGTKAVVGGLTIENGGFGSIASLNVIGGATIGGDLEITGNVTGGGLRKYAQIGAPANPIVGDVWYKTDTDVYYQYINDGTNKYWVDYAGATVSNASITSEQIAYDIVITTDTPSTSTTTGAVRVQGGIGLIGNIYTTGIADFGGNLTAGNVTANNNVQAKSLAVTQGATVGTSLTVGTTLDVTGALSSATLATGNSSVGNIAGYGFTTNAGNLTATGAYFSAGGMSSNNGNITVGNINAYSFIVSNGNITSTGTYARIGGLEIIDGGFANLASLGVIGAATIGADLAVTGNITGGGLRKTQSTTPPVNPVQGDIWYKTDSDVYYQYISDGTSSFWVDYTSAAVANITVSAETVGDLEIVSGTPSTDPTTGALRVAGGVGVTGDVNISSNITVGNVIAGTVYTPTIKASSFTYPNGASILDGYYFGTYSNANVGGYLTAQGIGTTSGNLTASGSYFSAAGLTALDGNIIATGARAVIGGLTIENGAFANLTSLGVIGSATIGGDLAITGNISAGGLRKYAQTSAPANPIVGDVWYKTDTDVYYQYITDGTTNVWVDFVSATVANITAANSQYGTDVGFVSGTLSTSPQTGAVTVIGGVGITGNINATGQITAAQQVQVQSLISNTSIAGETLSVTGAVVIGADTSIGGNTAIGGNLSAGNITGYGFSTNNGNVVATGKLTIGGLSIVPGNLSATGSYLAVNGFTALNGNITATGTAATIGGLTIENGGFGSIASLDVIGSATIGGNVTITGNVVGGGIRKTTSITAPVNPTIGDQWYKTDTDILYQFMDDGTSTYWVDFASATVANITNDFDGLGDFQTIGNVIGNGIVSDNYYYANGVSFVTTTVANTQNIVANITNGFNLGLDLTPTGVTAGNYGSATSIPTVVVDSKGRITSITSNAVSTTFGLVGNVGTSSINGGDTLVIVGTPNQISTTISGNTIEIGFTPNITFTDFTVSGNLIYQGGGIKTTTSPTPPVGPVNGDMWYQSGTDILYRYVYDGSNEYWLDLFSTPLRAILPSRDIGGDNGEVQWNDNGTFGANVNFAFDKTTGTLKVERLRITNTTAPTSPTSPGLKGEIAYDNEFMYLCIATNTWTRAALYTW
jgi:fibronectin-binding autotransporter adhesin